MNCTATNDHSEGENYTGQSISIAFNIHFDGCPMVALFTYSNVNGYIFIYIIHTLSTHTQIAYSHYKPHTFAQRNLSHRYEARFD